MALVLPTLIAGIQQSLKTAPTWAVTATLFANAVDNYVLSADINTVMQGTAIPPLPAPPYPAIAAGWTHPITVARAGLISAGISAFSSPSWSSVGSTLAPAINTLLLTAIVTTAVVGMVVGTGVGKITPTTLPILSAQLTTAFSLEKAWEKVAIDAGTAIHNFIISSIVNTTDFGIIPPISWAGVGIGGLK